MYYTGFYTCLSELFLRFFNNPTISLSTTI
nr:MAG TPA: hypothetical protein [Caudoviricetes sp.]